MPQMTLFLIYSSTYMASSENAMMWTLLGLMCCRFHSIHETPYHSCDNTCATCKWYYHIPKSWLV